MIGAIAGDVIGSLYEFNSIPVADGWALFDDGKRSFFTDDTVLTVATADVLANGGDYGEKYREYCLAWPDRGYGGRFVRWAHGQHARTDSYGNGSAMRVSPVGWFFGSLEETLREAERSALPTHGHPEGIKGAQAVAEAIWRFRRGQSVAAVRFALSDRYEYDLSGTTDEIRETCGFDETCQGSVPQAVVCALEGGDWERCVRLAVSLGADADTQACIAGAIAEARFDGVPPIVRALTLQRLPPEFLAVIRKFEERVGKASDPKARRGKN